MRILALDDERLALTVLVNAINCAIEDADVAQFSDPLAALDYIRNNAVDAIFCDYSMPGMNGIEFGKIVKQLCPQTDIVYVTGYSEYAPEAVNEVMPQGYILKPVSKAKIEAVMRNLHADVRNTGVFAQTFGTFELFKAGQPVTFKVKKAKELLAYLIDRNGAACTRKQLTAVLYETKDENNANRYFTDALKCLNETLDSIGARSILIRKFNSYAVDKMAFSCDLYQYLAGNINLYRGEYMLQYSWSEYSIGNFIKM